MNSINVVIFLSRYYRMVRVFAQRKFKKKFCMVSLASSLWSLDFFHLLSLEHSSPLIDRWLFARVIAVDFYI